MAACTHVFAVFFKIRELTLTDCHTFYWKAAVLFLFAVDD